MEDDHDEAAAAPQRSAPNGSAPNGKESAQASGADDLHEALSAVYHDLNNSLSVISGNAQLLAEMARAEELGAVFTEPLEDIEAARAEISEALSRLNDLRQEPALAQDEA